MIIYFVDTEPAEQNFFAARMEGHIVHFVAYLEAVGEDAEIVSLFLNGSIDEPFLKAHGSLKLVAARCYSTDHIDLEACAVRQVAVCSVPAYCEVTVAEHTFALILALSRRLRELMLMPTRGGFSYAACRGFDLGGKTLGIVGMGRIGRRVAALARGFAMEVLVSDPVPDPEAGRALGFCYVPLEELLKRSHIVSLHASLTPESYHVLDHAALAKCRRGVLVINTARGGLIDTAALRDALESGQVGGAGLDVLQDERVMRQSAAKIISAEIVKNVRGTGKPSRQTAGRLKDVKDLVEGSALLSRPNVVFTPHVAFNSAEAMETLREITMENIEAYLADKPANLV